MILFDYSLLKRIPLSIKPLYLHYTQIELVNKFKYKDLAFSQVLKYYSLDDIKEAFNSIYVEDNFIKIKDNTDEDRLLRLLEFGGQNVKASHLISDINKLIENSVKEDF